MPITRLPTNSLAWIETAMISNNQGVAVRQADDGTVYSWQGDGPAVALVHGLGLNRHMWQWQIPALSQHYRVLTYDLTGHGDSPKPRSEPDLHLFSSQLLGLLDEENVDQCAVMGFSLGGMIARRFAMDHGERLLALGILLSPHARSDKDQLAIEKRAEQVLQSGPESTVDAALERWFSQEFRQDNPETIQMVRGWVLANDSAVYPRNYRVLATGVEELIAPPNPIHCPTLVMAGEHDPGQTPQMARAIADEIPDARVEILAGLRHMALAEAPEICNPLLLSFLGQVTRE